ncbi:hypothetical protein [Psychrobacter sp. I-STPA6b]|uniref:hypothetical protein n=1 Tax=Psychrobacter sp. I-STPA6b TaxID=2585718 RepID=UPI001D0C90E7|nr:hypothetical protein [Psychrobacter sp. I-STPA6b]
MFQTIRKFFRLTNLDVLSNCYAQIAELYQQHHDNPDLVVAVTIEVMQKDKARTLAQNSLYWAWVTAIGNKLGLSKEEQHTQLKRKHLAKIFIRDDRQFAEMITALNQYKEIATPQEYEPLAKGVATLMSTTKATTKQMGEYLKDIDMFCYSENIPLPPKPDDYNWITGE